MYIAVYIKIEYKNDGNILDTNLKATHNIKPL